MHIGLLTLSFTLMAYCTCIGHWIGTKYYSDYFIVKQSQDISPYHLHALAIIIIELVVSSVSLFLIAQCHVQYMQHFTISTGSNEQVCMPSINTE